MIPHMRNRIWMLLAGALGSCGSQPAEALAPASPAVAQATITAADALTADDVGAVVIGNSITVPAYQELQLAAVVVRNGAFSAAESVVSCSGSSQQDTRPCRIVAFSPEAPLRPGATDTLVLVTGRTLRFPGHLYPLYGHNGPSALTPGRPYVEIADLVYAQPEVSSFSNDVERSAGVAFAIHLYARLVPISSDNQYFQELHAPGSGHSYYRSLPIRTLREITGREMTAPASLPSKSAGTF